MTPRLAFEISTRVSIISRKVSNRWSRNTLPYFFQVILHLPEKQIPEKMPSLRKVNLGTLEKKCFTLIQKSRNSSKFSIQMSRETLRDDSETRIGDTQKNNC